MNKLRLALKIIASEKDDLINIPFDWLEVI